MTLSWTASAGASSYAYCIDTTNDGACSNWISAGANTSVVLSGLAIGTTYLWHVRAMNSYRTTYSDGSDARGYRAFSTLGYPAALSKTSQANGVTVGSTTLTLSWGTSASAASYGSCIDTTNDNACSTWTSTGSTTSAVLSNLPDTFTKYYWHVRAIDAIGTTYSQRQRHSLLDLRQGRVSRHVRPDKPGKWFGCELDQRCDAYMDRELWSDLVTLLRRHHQRRRVQQLDQYRREHQRHAQRPF